MSATPPVHLLIAAVAERRPGDAGRVFARVAAALGPGGIAASLRRAVALPDAFVAVVAEHGGDEERAALARNTCLTASQLMVLIAAGGRSTVRAAFSPPESETRRHNPVVASRGPETTPLPDLPDDVVAAADKQPEEVDPATAVALLQSADCPPERALGLLRAHPHLVHAARVPTIDPALPWSHNTLARLTTLPLRLDLPWESVTALDEAETALGRGALTPDDLCGRVAPALVGVQAMARLVRSRAPRFPDKAAADAVVRPLLARTVGADPRAWARLATRLAAATTPITRLLEDIADEPRESAPAGVPRIAPPTKARPALLFLVRRLPVDEISALLPYFDEQTTEDLIQGDAPIPTELLELAHTTGNRVLLRKVAGHQHLRDEEALRVREHDDVELDRHLAWNRAGVTAALRREIVAGRVPGTHVRRPMDPVLRQWVLEDRTHLDPKTLAFSGDPELVCLALADRPKLRKIDLVDVVVSLWERNGPEAAAGVVTSVPEAFPAAVRKVVDAAFANGSTDQLDAARKRWDRGAKARGHASDTAAVETDPRERLRHHELSPSPGSNEWVRPVPPEDVVRFGRVAASGLDALPLLCSDGRAEEVLAALAGLVCEPLGDDLEAWAVLTQLLPDFAGTLPELAELCAVVAHRPEGDA